MGCLAFPEAGVIFGPPLASWTVRFKEPCENKQLSQDQSNTDDDDGVLCARPGVESFRKCANYAWSDDAAGSVDRAVSDTWANDAAGSVDWAVSDTWSDDAAGSVDWAVGDTWANDAAGSVDWAIGDTWADDAAGSVDRLGQPAEYLVPPPPTARGHRSAFLARRRWAPPSARTSARSRATLLTVLPCAS
jgi:hypothetical protein